MTQSKFYIGDAQIGATVKDLVSRFGICASLI